MDATVIPLTEDEKFKLALAAIVLSGIKSRVVCSNNGAECRESIAATDLLITEVISRRQ